MSVQISAMAWAEFLCGPLSEKQIELARRLLEEPLPFDADDASLTAELYNATGRRRGSLARLHDWRDRGPQWCPIGDAEQVGFFADDGVGTPLGLTVPGADKRAAARYARRRLDPSDSLFAKDSA